MKKRLRPGLVYGIPIGPMDSMTIGAALSGASNVVSIIKGLASAAKADGKVEAMGKIMDLQSAMHDLQGQITDLVLERQKLAEENIALKGALKEARELVNVKGNLQYHHGAYWLPQEGEALVGPYSAFEWDKNLKLVRLTGTSGNQETFTYKCHASDSYVHIPTVFLLDHYVCSVEEIDHTIALHRPRVSNVRRPSRSPFI